ncbi:MAG: hypothetical protein ABTQ32_08780 [Myxococcaceae bacterium]
MRIDVAPADWEVLRNQTRDLFTLLSGNLAEPAVARAEVRRERSEAEGLGPRR